MRNDIIKASVFLREKNNTIPSEVIEFMKQSALKAWDEAEKKVAKRNLYNGDFRKYFDTTQQRNIWALGYFGGGSLNAVEVMQVATDYAKANNVPIDTVVFDEILHSSRFKSFKVVYSQHEGQKPVGVNKSDVMENVWQWLRD